MTSSSKVEERRRFLRTVVNEINGKKKEMCTPVDNAALSPCKSVLVSSTTAPHAYPATDRDVLANSVVSTPNASSIINSGRLANSYMHREEKALSQVSRKPAPPRHGEMLLLAAPERHGVSIVSNTTPSLSGRVLPSWNTASTSCSPTPIPLTWGLPYLKPGDFKKPSTKKTDVTSMAGTSAGMNLTASDTAHLPRTVTPTSSSPWTPHVTIPDDVKTCQGVSRMARQVVEALTRLETAASQSGMMLSANSIERSDERSSVNIGPAVEQALAFISSEVGEKRQAPDAICPDESAPPLGWVSRQQRPSTVDVPDVGLV